MGKRFFNSITRLSIRFKWLTITITIILLGLGIYSALDLKVEMLPDIDVPSTFTVAQSNGNTDGNLMLQAYTVPIEEGAEGNKDILNTETTTTTGLVFAQFSNEFGLDQTQVNRDLRAALDRVKLPLRAITPPDGVTAGDMIGNLTPDVILYLYAYAEAEDVGFLPMLDKEVWPYFSPEVLGALPDDAFATLDPFLAEELRAKATGEPQDLPDLATVTPPALPESWQMDRFATAEDLTELTGAKNLANIFNDFLQEGIIKGPLGQVSDLTLDDMALILTIEDQCRAHTAADADITAGEGDSCSMLAYLDGDAMSALLAHFQARIDGVLADNIRLPEGYLGLFKQDEQNQIATMLLAQSLAGTGATRDAPLPDEWRLNPPELVTFSFDDLPLGVISISAKAADSPRPTCTIWWKTKLCPRSNPSM